MLRTIRYSAFAMIGACTIVGNGFAKDTKTVTVIIESNPSNASVFMNQTFRGQTPLRYKVEIPKAAYKEANSTGWCHEFPVVVQWQSGVKSDQSPRGCFVKGKFKVFVPRPEGPYLDIDLLAEQIQALAQTPRAVAVPIPPTPPARSETIINVPPPRTSDHCMVNGDHIWCF